MLFFYKTPLFKSLVAGCHVSRASTARMVMSRQTKLEPQYAGINEIQSRAVSCDSSCEYCV